MAVNRNSLKKKVKKKQPCPKIWLYWSKFAINTKIEIKYETNTNTFFSITMNNFDPYPISIKKYSLHYELYLVRVTSTNVIPSFL